MNIDFICKKYNLTKKEIAKILKISLSKLHRYEKGIFDVTDIKIVVTSFNVKYEDILE